MEVYCPHNSSVLKSRCFDIPLLKIYSETQCRSAILFNRNIIYIVTLIIAIKYYSERNLNVTGYPSLIILMRQRICLHCQCVVFITCNDIEIYRLPTKPNIVFSCILVSIIVVDNCIWNKEKKIFSPLLHFCSINFNMSSCRKDI